MQHKRTKHDLTFAYYNETDISEMSELHSQVPPLVKIDTERLQLKTVMMEDLDEIMPIITDLRVMRWT